MRVRGWAKRQLAAAVRARLGGADARGGWAEQQHGWRSDGRRWRTRLSQGRRWLILGGPSFLHGRRRRLI
uniref:Uncharacterized protein n=1 Tax=Setaria italica TaxID=4555 RepID=K3Y4K7_SETIT